MSNSPPENLKEVALNIRLSCGIFSIAASVRKGQMSNVQLSLLSQAEVLLKTEEIRRGN